MLYLCNMEKELKDFLLDEISFNVGEAHSLIDIESKIDRLYDDSKDIDENIDIISSIITKQYEFDFENASNEYKNEVEKLNTLLKESNNDYLANLFKHRIKEEEEKYKKAKENYKKMKGMDN